jgi:hypothetical protein
VAIEDALGNVETNDNTDTVTVAIGTNPSSGTLSGTTTVTVVAGVATFTGLSINKAGTGYTLGATSVPLTSATSSTFNITPGTPTQLAFTTSPSNSTGGVAFGTQPVVTVEDADGNPVTSDTSNVTLAITAVTPATGGPGALTCTAITVAAVAGVATFAGCKIDTAGTLYRLTATDGTFTSVNSATFNITNPATKVVFTTSPSNSASGSVFAGQPVVTVEDAGGNPVTSGPNSNASINLAISSQPGSGATLACTTNPLAATNGVASFAGCKIVGQAGSYKLTATASGLTSALSSAFNITNSPGPGQPQFKGYWLAASDGGIFAFGDAQFFGSTGAIHLNKPIVGMASTPDSKGYWLVASDGGIFAFGDAQFFGSTGSLHLNKPIVGMASTPDGKGYWLVASDGGIFTFGDAQFFGSTGSLHLNRPIVGMTATPDGKGYWLVASDGGIFTFGTAQYFGSTGALTLNKPIVGMTATPDGKGYWLVASDGGLFTFGDAQYFGSTGALTLNKPIVGMASSPDGLGYWLVASDGGIFTFGTAQFFGSTGSLHLNRPIVGMQGSL